MLGLLLLLFVASEASAWSYLHTATVRNNTGETAEDLHVQLIHNVYPGSTPSAPPFTTAATGATEINFDGGQVANGASVPVAWRSAFASDTLLPGAEGHWTKKNANGNSVDIGDVVVVASLGTVITDMGGGMVLVQINNFGANAVAYTDLRLSNGVDGDLFNEQDYLTGLDTGSLVNLLVSPGGIFDPGLTDVAMFSPDLQDGRYAGGSLRVEGDLFAHAGSNAPIPPTWTLLALGMAILLARRRPLTGT